MNRLILILLISIFLVGCQPVGTTTPISPSATTLSPTANIPPTLSDNFNNHIDQLQDFIDGLVNDDKFSGAVLVALNGKPVFQEAYGMANREKQIPNNLDTKFNLGSMDKMFTAVAIMQLVEQGKVSLQAKAGEYLPDYPNREVVDAVTIHQLLTHTSGMGDYFNHESYPDVHDKLRSIEDYLPLFVDTPLLFQPGLKFSYSNSGFIVLGLIIEAVSGESYYDYVRTHIFEPAGMKDTACYEVDAGTPNLAIGYTTYDHEWNDTGVITDNSWFIPMRGASAGGGYSTTPDLLAFANALMGYRLLTEESTALLLKGKVDREANVKYAYGFGDSMIAGHRMVGHSGGAEGICSFLNIYPELGYTFVVLSNTDSGCFLVQDYIENTILN